jgi:hypothetical protein
MSPWITPRPSISLGIDAPTIVEGQTRRASPTWSPAATIDRPPRLVWFGLDGRPDALTPSSTVAGGRHRAGHQRERRPGAGAIPLPTSIAG